MLWHIELKCCIWLSFIVLRIKFECRQLVLIFVGVLPLLELRILGIHIFRHFSLTRFDILSWNYAYYYVLLYYRLRSSVVSLRQFLWKWCPFWNFWNLDYWKYIVFRTFLLHALTYWGEILHMIFFTVLQIKFECYKFASSSVGVMPLWNLEYLKYTVFYTFLLRSLTYWTEIFDFIKCTIDQVSSLCVRLSSYFLHFPPTCIDKFSWNLKFDVCFFIGFF